MNDNNSVIEQENKALKDANKFLKKLNLDIQSKHQRNLYSSMLEMGPKAKTSNTGASSNFIELANEMKKNFTSMDLTPPRKNEFTNTTYHNRTVSKQIETYTNSLVDNGKPSANYDRSRNEEIETQASNDKHFRL